MNLTFDDRTVRYVTAAQPVFEDLRQVVAQLAGLLVLAATGSKDSTPEHPMLSASKLVLAKAREGVKRIPVPAADRARLHHRELTDATAALEEAMTFADAWPIDVDGVLHPLRNAYAHLERAAHALPGFQIVSFEQACCGHDDQRGARGARGVDFFR